MIIVSPNVVLSPSPDFNANSPVIGWQSVVSGVAAESEDADYPATNLLNESTALRWQAGSGASQYLTFTVPGTDETDYLAVARHNFGTIQATLSVEVREAGEVSWVEVIPEFIPSDDAALIMRFDPQFVDAVRLKIQPDGEIPRAAVAYAGRLLIMQRRLYVGHVPITMGRSSRVTSGTTESGDFLGRIVLSQGLSTAAEFQNLTPAWVRTYLKPFLDAATETPFFFAWRPADYPTEVGFAWLTNDPRPSNQRPNGMMQVSLQMQGVAS